MLLSSFPHVTKTICAECYLDIYRLNWCQHWHKAKTIKNQPLKNRSEARIFLSVNGKAGTLTHTRYFGMQTEHLTLREQTALAEHEAVIERGLQTFYEVGTALLAIRDERLYREQYPTFEAYCQERWDMGRRYANNLIAAAEVVVNLGAIVPIPETESQARPLTALEPEAQRIVWEVVQQTAPAGKVTAAHVFFPQRGLTPL